MNMQQDTTHVDAPQSDMASEAYLAQLKATFEQLPNDIPLYLFAAKGHEDVFTQANRQVIRAFRELSGKINLREYDLDHELAKKWNVTSSPDLADCTGTILHSMVGRTHGGRSTNVA